jgi:beta-glucosidase
LAATGKPIVLILNEGRPRIVNDIEPLASSIINILLPGNYGGDALANILDGSVNPSAKMPYTYPRNQAALTTYDYRVSEETDKMEGAYDYDAVISVQWPFGYDLSYTTFEYSNFKTNITSFTAEDELHFSVDITNSGTQSGKEVVMLFSRDLVASLTPESRRLRAFKKVELQAGETQTVTLSIKGSDLAFVGADGKWILEQGDFVCKAVIKH